MEKSQKIKITPSMIINDMGIENVSNFFCEYDTDGDPLYGKTGAIPQVHPRFDHWWVAQTDLEFTIDLEAEYQITNVYLYNNYGAFPAQMRMGTPFAWEFEKTFTPKDKEWTGFEAKAQTQFIQFQFNNNHAPSEIVIYGYKVKEVEKKVPERKEHKKTDMNRFIGINAFVNDADDVLRCSNYVREYHPWLWTCHPKEEKTEICFNPSDNRAWDFDEFYTKLKKFGIDCCPTISSHAKRSPKDNKFSTTDPREYTSFATMLYQFVLRYGNNQNASKNELQLSKGQEKKIGLDVLSWVEPLNEPDGTWSGREQYFSPFELACFLSMCYDGHCGQYPNVGVKNADPNFKMSMSGGAGLNMNYLRAMQFWCTYNRKDGKLPFDAINAHRYVGKQVTIDGKGKLVDINTEDRGENSVQNVYIGISPDEGKVEHLFDEVRDFRDRYYPDMEIWLTEFGWDTNQSYKTTTSAHAYAKYTGRQVQAMWLVREYLLLSSTGMERAAMYMSRDVAPEEKAVGKYGSSGLVRFPIEISANEVVQGNKKDSYYYIYTLKRLLGHSSFDCEIPSENENVRVFRYLKDNGGYVYALWCVTSDNTKVRYRLAVEKGKKYESVELVNESVNGKRKDLFVRSGEVALTVTENPIFVCEK